MLVRWFIHACLKDFKFGYVFSDFSSELQSFTTLSTNVRCPVSVLNVEFVCNVYFGLLGHVVLFEEQRCFGCQVELKHESLSRSKHAQIRLIWKPIKTDISGSSWDYGVCIHLQYDFALVKSGFDLMSEGKTLWNSIVIKQWIKFKFLNNNLFII